MFGCALLCLLKFHFAKESCGRVSCNSSNFRTALRCRHAHQFGYKRPSNSGSLKRRRYRHMAQFQFLIVCPNSNQTSYDTAVQLCAQFNLIPLNHELVSDIAWKSERLPKCLPKKLVQLSCVVIGLNDFHFNWFRHLLSRRTAQITGGGTPYRAFVLFAFACFNCP